MNINPNTFLNNRITQFLGKGGNPGNIINVPNPSRPLFQGRSLGSPVPVLPDGPNAFNDPITRFVNKTVTGVKGAVKPLMNTNNIYSARPGVANPLQSVYNTSMDKIRGTGYPKTTPVTGKVGIGPVGGIGAGIVSQIVMDKWGNPIAQDLGTRLGRGLRGMFPEEEQKAWDVIRNKRDGVLSDIRGGEKPGSWTPMSAELAKKQEAELYAAANASTPIQLTDPTRTTPLPPQRPLREADPLPTTLAEAYGSGRLIGRPNNTGFSDIDWKMTEEMMNQPGVMWNTDINPSVVPQAESVYNLMNTNPGIYNSVEGLPAGVGFNDIDLNTGIYDTMLPQSQPMTGLQALRADEKSRGLLYASGKYWAENADGKLEAIPTDLIDGEGTARQQAIAFMENKKQPIVEAVQGETSKATEGPVTLESFQPYVSDKPMGDAQSMFYQYQDLVGDQGLTEEDAFATATRFQGIQLPGK